MPIVTLINDWQRDSLYSAQIKSKLVGLSKDINIIDLVNNVENYDIVNAAFILKNSYYNFPPGTIHLNFVDNSNKNNDLIVVKSNNHFFVSKNNGFLSLIFPINTQKSYKITNSNTANELTLYTEIVKAIINKKILKIATEINPRNILKTIFISPSISQEQIIAHIIYIDGYGNLITNLEKKVFEKFRKDKEIKIFFKSENKYIDKISEKYKDVDSGEFVAFFNSIGLLEIAQRDGNIAELYDVSKNTGIRVEKK